LRSKLQQIFSSFDVEDTLETFRDNYTILIAAIGIAFLISIVFSFLLRLFTGTIVILAILLFYVGVAFTSYLLWTKYSFYKSNTESIDEDPTATKTSSIYLWGFVALMLVAIIFTLILIVLRSKILLAVRIIKATGEFVGVNPLIILIPIITTLLSGIVFCGWAFIVVNIFANGNLSHSSYLPISKITLDAKFTWMFRASIFGLLWYLASLLGVSHFLTSGAAVFWYFERGTSDNSPISKSLAALFVHFGSVTFGSLVLALLWAVRIIFEFYMQDARQGLKDNKVAEYLKACVSCFLTCMEKMVKFFNRHSYTEIILKGKSFCPSTISAMELISKNSLRFGVLHGLTELILLFARLSLTMGSTYICYFILTKSTWYNTESGSPLFVLLGVRRC